MKEIDVKQEAFQPPHFLHEKEAVLGKQTTNNNAMSISSSASNGCTTISFDSDSDDDSDFEGSLERKPRILAALPVGFLVAMQLSNDGNNKNGVFNGALMLNGPLDFDIKSIKEEEPFMMVMEGNGWSTGMVLTRAIVLSSFGRQGIMTGLVMPSCRKRKMLPLIMLEFILTSCIRKPPATNGL